MLRNIINRLLHFLAFILPGGKSLRPWLHKKRGVSIGNNVWISKLVYIDELHPEAVTIGDNSTLGLRTSIITHLYWGERKSNLAGPVIIGKDVYIGAHSVILPNVTIGNGSVIKAGTVVTRNVPPNTFWGMPSAGPLSKVTVPLTDKYSYDEFLAGLKPIRNRENQSKKPFMT